MNIEFPLHFDSRGLTAEATEEHHIRGLIEQLLFTSPGERVNRPTFGSGLMQLVFAANSPELAAAVQVMVQGSLQQWLGELIHVEAVDVTSHDAELIVEVRFVIRRTQQRQLASFTKEIS
jgi:phage baseplate assembly protein W